MISGINTSAVMAANFGSMTRAVEKSPVVSVAQKALSNQATGMAGFVEKIKAAFTTNPKLAWGVVAAVVTVIALVTLFAVKSCCKKEEAGTDTDKPVKDGDKPVKDGDKPVKDGDKPVKDGDKPVKDGDKPVKDGDKPVKDGDKPVKDGDKPVKDGDKQTKKADK